MVEEEDRPVFFGDLARSVILDGIGDALRERVAEEKFVYVGPGSEKRFETTGIRLSLIVDWLLGRGYSKHYIRMAFLGASGTEISMTAKILTDSSTTYGEVWKNREVICQAMLEDLH